MNENRITLKKTVGHFVTITKHRLLVRRNCFQMGLIRQGFTHDLSKYSFAEFWKGARYFQGTRSPNARERELYGFSSAWLHHKGRNKHHFEYWIDMYDINRDGTGNGIVPAPMPDRYVAEMIADRVAASMVYKGADYTPAASLEYYEKEKPVAKKLMHPDTMNKLEFFLNMLADQGEAATFKYIREIFLKGKDRLRWEKELEESLN